MVDIYRVFTPKNKDDFYLLIYNISTIVIIILYIVVMLRIEFGNYGKYLGIVTTVRNIFLALFLIYFYNPFRTSYNYGRILPIFATGAGIALILTITKFDILNLLHFCRYGTLLENPKKI
jgi:hypothetical protein